MLEGHVTRPCPAEGADAGNSPFNKGRADGITIEPLQIAALVGCMEGRRRRVEGRASQIGEAGQRICEG